jgi:hypothetical protein
VFGTRWGARLSAAEPPLFNDSGARSRCYEVAALLNKSG